MAMPVPSGEDILWNHQEAWLSSYCLHCIGAHARRIEQRRHPTVETVRKAHSPPPA